MGFDLHLSALQTPESIRWMPFWGAAHVLLETLEDNEPGGPFADPDLVLRSPGETVLRVASDGAWAEPARGSDDPSRDASFPRLGRSGYPNLIVLPPEVAAPRWRRDAASEIAQIRWREENWSNYGGSGKNYDGSQEIARLEATSGWLENLPADVLIFLTLWDRS